MKPKTSTFLQLAVLAAGLFTGAASSSQAATLFTATAPTTEMAIATAPGTLVTTPNFQAGAGAGLLTFTLTGFATVDGLITGSEAGFTDMFSVGLNNTPIFSGDFRLGGIGTDTAVNPNSGTFEITRTGTDPNNADGAGGSVAFSIPISLLAGSNFVAFNYATPVGQGIGDEGFALSNILVTGNAAGSSVAVPGPIAGAGLVPLFGLAGAWFMRRRKQAA